MSTIYEDRKTDIEHGSVKRSIEKIEANSKTMGQEFADFRTAMSKVYSEENFAGNASDSLQEKFDELQKKFDSYNDAVTRFAKVVEAARASTEATEQEIQNDAGNLAA